MSLDETARGCGEDARKMGALAAIGVVFACAAVFSAPPLNADTSWLLTVGERVLAGQRLGLDVIEVNPPASVWLYLPAVALAQVFGVRPDWLVVGMTFIVAAASLALTDAMLRRAPALARWRFVVALGCAVGYLWLPRDAFTQREHFALMLIVPAAMGCAARAWRAPPRWPLALAAGLCAGVAIAIKPPFGLALAGPALAAAAYRGSARALFTLEACVAAGVLALYVAAALVFAPGFFEVVLPAVRDVYLVRWEFRPAFYLALWAPAVLLLAPSLRGRDAWRSPHGVLLLVALGFVVVFAAQGKNWIYHAFPATAALVAASLGAALRRRGLARLAAATGALVSVALYGAAAAPPSREIAEVAAALPDLGRPLSVLTVLDDHGPVEPALRATGARSVGRLLTAWPIGYVDLLPPSPDAAVQARRAEIRRWGAQVFQEDLERLQPDVVLIQRGLDDYMPLMTESVAAASVYTYTRRVEQRRALDVWVRDAPPEDLMSAALKPTMF